MAKNDVEMVIRAKDETGNGIDSARKKFGELQKTIGGGSGAGGGGLVESTIKMGLAVNALRGSFTVVSSLVSAFNGDSQAAADALARLPLGIGEVIREFNSMLNVFDAGKKSAEAFSKAIYDLRQLTIAEEAKLGTGIEADVNRVRVMGMAEIEKAEKEARDAMANNPFPQGREMAIEINKRIDAIKARLKQEEEAIRESYYKRDQDRIAAFERERDATLKEARKLAEETAKAKLEAEMKADRARTNLSDFGAAARFGMAADLRNLFAGPETSGIPEIDRSAIDMAMKAIRGGGASQLAGGQQDRFGTGLAASARESSARMARETADATKESAKKLEDIRKLLEEANQPPAVPGINLEMLEGLT